MMTAHISEQDIVSYVLRDLPPEANVEQHLVTCMQCQAKVAQYEVLFSSVASLPKPSFDFDVVELVMPQLTVSHKKSNKFPVIIAILILLAALPALPFLLFANSRTNALQIVSPWLLGMVAVVTIAFVAISVSDMYAGYRRRLNQLNVE